MTDRPAQEYPDWLIPAILAGLGLVVVLALVGFFVVRSTSVQDETLADQMERWTTCLRSEGAPVPLVEAIGDEGFRVTVDDMVLDAQFDSDLFGLAFELCLDDAPDGVRTVAEAIEGISSLPFGKGDFGWLGPLLFDLGDSGLLHDDGMGGPPIGDPPLDELCAYVSDLDVLPPDVGADLLDLCAFAPNV